MDPFPLAQTPTPIDFGTLQMPLLEDAMCPDAEMMDWQQLVISTWIEGTQFITVHPYRQNMGMIVAATNASRYFVKAAHVRIDTTPPTLHRNWPYTAVFHYASKTVQSADNVSTFEVGDMVVCAHQRWANIYVLERSTEDIYDLVEPAEADWISVTSDLQFLMPPQRVRVSPLFGGSIYVRHSGFDVMQPPIGDEATVLYPFCSDFWIVPRDPTMLRLIADADKPPVLK